MLGCCYNHDGIQICTASEVGRRPSPVGKKIGVYLWMRRRTVLLGSKVIESVGEIKPRYILGRWKKSRFTHLWSFLFLGHWYVGLTSKPGTLKFSIWKNRLISYQRLKEAVISNTCPLIFSQCHSALSEVVWDEVLCIFVVKLMSQTGHVRIQQPVALTYRQCRVDTGVL